MSTFAEPNLNGGVLDGDNSDGLNLLKIKVGEARVRMSMFAEPNLNGGVLDGDNSDGLNLLKIKVGETRVRILPPLATFGSPEWVKQTARHYGFNIGGTFTKYICPRSVGRVACPICNHATALYNIGDEQSRKTYSRIKSKPEFFYNVYDVIRADNIYQMRAPKTLHDQIKRVIGGYGNIMDVKAGYNLIITCTSKASGNNSFGTSKASGNNSFLEYSVLPERDATPVPEHILRMIAQPGKMVDLSKLFVTAASDEELIAALKFIDTKDRTADANRHQIVSPGQPMPVQAQPTTVPAPQCMKAGMFDSTCAECVPCQYKGQCQDIKASLRTAIQRQPVTAAPAVTTSAPDSYTPTPAVAPVVPATPSVQPAPATGMVDMDALERKLRGGK